MSAPEVRDLLSLAHRQMASEGNGVQGAIGDAVRLARAIELGNVRSSQTPAITADEIATSTSVLAFARTATGFAGTLFEDSDRTLHLSFRSTEFIDDAARDNQATNALEIKRFGWAFGQIADMEAWYRGLRASGAIPEGAAINVTGYSLGGHLATAFHLLRQEEGSEDSIAGTYTFNGAGVGALRPEAQGSLSGVIDEFQRMRRDGSLDAFQDGLAQSLYQRIRGEQQVAPINADLIASQRRLVQAAVLQPLDDPQLYTRRREELFLLDAALERIESVEFENQRVGGVHPSSGPGLASPTRPATTLAEIAALGIDYQLAVLRAGTLTRPFRSDVVLGALQAMPGGRNTLPGLSRIYDIYGSTFRGDDFTAVANSQHHYGEAIPIFIEDQPLYRGDVISEVAASSSLAQGIKLLVPSFDKNDFGDTHSLVLMVDSLAVQSVLTRLDPTLSHGALATIMVDAGNRSGISSPGTQGKADGDTLELLVESMGNLLGVSSEAGWRALRPSPEGGTWAEIGAKDGYTGREALHENIKLLNDRLTQRGWEGKFVVDSLADLDADALYRLALMPEQVALRYALMQLDPFIVRERAPAETGLFRDLHNAGGELDLFDARLAQRSGTMTAAFLRDRAQFLAVKQTQNSTNRFWVQGEANTAYRDVSRREAPYEVDVVTGVLTTGAELAAQNGRDGKIPWESGQKPNACVLRL